MNGKDAVAMVKRQWTLAAKWRGLLIAAVFAWAGSSIIMFVVPELRSAIFAAFIGRDYSFDTPMATVLAWVNVLVFYGLPIALMGVLLLGFPFWAWAERQGLTTHVDAISAGAKAGLVIVVLEVLATLFFAMTTLGTSQSHTYGFELSENGFPTLLGWLFFASDAALTVILGAATGLVARIVAGEPRKKPTDRGSPAAP